MIRTQPSITVKETIGTLRTNTPLAFLCASSFFYLIGLFAVGGATAFYAQYVLNNIGLIGLITLVNVGIALLITPFIPKLIDIFGKKNVFQFCGVFTIVGGVALFFAPGNILWLVLLALAIKGIGASLINTVMFGLEADTVEYGEWKTGRRSEGATYALFSFTRKVTQSLGGALGAWALAIGAYVAASAANPNPVQPASAIIAIKATIGLVPAMAALLAMLIFIKYPLNDKRFQEIRDETEARKLAAITAHHERPEDFVTPDHTVRRGAPTANQGAWMSKPDLTAIPYELDEEAIAWVRSTIDSMSVDEKVGQLFINLNNRFDDDFVNRIVDGYHPGGMRYNHTDSASIQAHIRHAQPVEGAVVGCLEHRGRR